MNKNGFTLIELLVVISIISLLSSIVFSSLNSAREGAKDAAIKSSVRELATVSQLNFNEYTTYTQITAGSWNSSEAQCDADFSGNFAEKARELCKVVVANSPETGVGSGKFYTGVQSGDYDSSFSIMARLNNGNIFCIGSSGGNYEGPVVADTQSWDGPGCWRNP